MQVARHLVWWRIAGALLLARGGRWPLTAVAFGPAALLLIGVLAWPTERALLRAIPALVVAAGALGMVLALRWERRVWRYPASPAAIAFALAREPAEVVRRVAEKHRDWSSDPGAPPVTLALVAQWINAAREALALPGTTAATRREQAQTMAPIAASAGT